MAGNFMSAQARRIATLAAHLRAPSVAMGEGRLRMFATMANSSSVFEQVQQAPEDPILGVCLCSLFLSITHVSRYLILAILDNLMRVDFVGNYTNFVIKVS